MGLLQNQDNFFFKLSSEPPTFKIFKTELWCKLNNKVVQLSESFFNSTF